MMTRILETFKIRPEEQRVAALLVGLMLFTSAGGAIGGNAIEALFFARFGVALLPYMYVVLGLFSFGMSFVITALMGRIARERLYVALPFVLGFTLIAERLIIFLDFKWFYAVMWLAMNVIGSLQGLLTWGLAGAACDTRQAKRLFPLFSAGGILGTVIGGLATQPLAQWLHSENLLVVWAGALFISYVLGRLLIGNKPVVKASRQKQPGIIVEMQRGYQFVRRSPIMQWVSYSAILFSVCYFSLALPFSRGATAQFQNADDLAGFLGLFQSLNTAVALAASLFLANRLFTRFGIMPMLLVFPLIYFAGFAVLAFYTPFAILVIARFAQMVWMQGIAGTAWQALFNVVPPAQRDQVRAFVGGVPEQAGTFIAGLILIVGEQTLQPQQLYFVGLAAAGLTVYVIWRAGRAYRGALVQALRAGQPQMFLSDQESPNGFKQDAAAIAAVIEGIRSPDPVVRRVSAEILGDISDPKATTALVGALADADATVRAASLRGLAHAKAASVLPEIADCLNDPEPEVRRCALDALYQLSDPSSHILQKVEPLLEDADPYVRARAAILLVRSGPHDQAHHTLRSMATDPDPQVRVSALDALGESDEKEMFEFVLAGLTDPHATPLVRRAAATSLARIDPERALEPLVHALNDDDRTVREALAAALGQIGEPALAPVVTALTNPSYEDAALRALEYLPADQAAAQIGTHARDTIRIALQYHNLALGLRRRFENETNEDDGRWQLIIDSVHDKSHRAGINALRGMALLDDREAISVAIENLKSRDPAQRANALETLESIRARELVRPLLQIWETDEISGAAPDDWLLQLLNDPYSWLRACAVLVAESSSDPRIHAALQSLTQSDPDEFVRATAAHALTGDHSMDTLATLSLMERVLFLRHVPLFTDLPPADLKQVAAIANECLFDDGETLAREGEPGNEMHIVVSGEVRVVVEKGGQGHEIARRKSGDYVGEMAIISQEPRMASLVTAGQVRTLCIDQKSFEAILRERPETSLAVMRVLCQRLKEAS
jgi:HEAT repeat protein